MMKPSLLELSHIPIFSALSEAQFQVLICDAQCISLSRNECLFHRGDESLLFYYLVSGEIKVSRSTPQGGEKILSIVRSRQLFAEAAMFLESRQYPATTTALQACEVIGFSSQALIQLLHESTDLSLALIGNLSMKLHSQIVEIDILSLQNATFRLLYLINSLMVSSDDGGADVVFPAPKHAIASRLSITPETLSRSLQSLNKKNIVVSTGKDRKLRVPSTEVLREYLMSHQS